MKLICSNGRRGSPARTDGISIPKKTTCVPVIRGLVRNKEKFGRPYCPCRLRSGDEERDRAIECPCIYHKDEIAKEGHCHCLLYYKKP